VIKVDFSLKEKLDRYLGGELHSYCYQCGACVGDCPAARYSSEFNPRKIMLMTIVGAVEELVRPNSIIWECTNCCNCYERCPQDVRPVEVIIALKNMNTEAGFEPEEVKKVVASIREKGRSAEATKLTNKRRAELGLEPLKEFPADEFARLMSVFEEEKKEDGK
jgi:heterodisulfide reductase subunit C